MDGHGFEGVEDFLVVNFFLIQGNQGMVWGKRFFGFCGVKVEVVWGAIEPYAKLLHVLIGDAVSLTSAKGMGKCARQTNVFL